MELSKNETQTHKNPLVKDFLIFSTIWVIILLTLIRPGIADDYSFFWVMAVLPALPLYIYFSAKFIPRLRANNKGFSAYALRFLVVSGITELAIVLIYDILIHQHTLEPNLEIFIMCYGTQMLFVMPGIWLINVNRLLRSQEKGLKTELGKSSADLGFLRSQINPHFLFNTLNTLYGTALQEQATRTSEGIQKLGDMMRFMLQENMQDKIPLAREVEYLTNYVDLQKLRVQTSPDIVIDVNIENQHNYLLIAPMLLIPFVENAFKHGISLQEPSYIKISLHTEDNRLYFDIFNSTHARKENDPEQNNHGIGMENVAQRLNLLYNGTHEMVIHESVKEFFVHLVINLTAEIAIIE